MKWKENSGTEPSELSCTIRDRINRARVIQQQRFSGEGIHCNAQMASSQLRKYCGLDEPSQTFLKNTMEKFGRSDCANDRILKVSRTIADLDREECLKASYIAEAIQYRNIDLSVWRN